MNWIKNYSDKDQVMIRLITANANFMKDTILESNKSPEEKEKELDILREKVKERLLNILLKY